MQVGRRMAGPNLLFGFSEDWRQVSRDIFWFRINIFDEHLMKQALRLTVESLAKEPQIAETMWLAKPLYYRPLHRDVLFGIRGVDECFPTRAALGNNAVLEKHDTAVVNLTRLRFISTRRHSFFGKSGEELN